MKKLLYAIPVLCAIVLTGCPSDKKNPDDPTSGITAITVKPANVTLAEGADMTLTVIPEPKGAKGVYTWVSSDTTVAIVDGEGKVTAITAGTAIVTATEKGGAKASSEIHVTSYLESFSFSSAQAYLTPTSDTTGLPIYARVLKSGDTLRYYFLPMEVLVFSDGCYFNDQGDLSGSEEALLITMQGYAMYAPESMNKTYKGLFCLGPWEIIKDSSEYYTMTAEPGVYEPAMLTNVLAAMDAYNQQNYTDFSAYLTAARESVSGTIMESIVYACDSTNTKCGYYNGNYLVDAVLESAYFYIGGTDGSSKYMNMVDYCKFSFRAPKDNGEDFWWGVNATFDEENERFTILDRSQLYLSEPITMEFGEKPAEEVLSRNEPIKLSDDLNTLPDNVRANINRQIKEGKIRPINSLLRK